MKCSFISCHCFELQRVNYNETWNTIAPFEVSVIALIIRRGTGKSSYFWMELTLLKGSPRFLWFLFRTSVRIDCSIVSTVGESSGAFTYYLTKPTKLKPAVSILVGWWIRSLHLSKERKAVVVCRVACLYYPLTKTKELHFCHVAWITWDNILRLFLFRSLFQSQIPRLRIFTPNSFRKLKRNSLSPRLREFLAPLPLPLN